MPGETIDRRQTRLGCMVMVAACDLVQTVFLLHPFSLKPGRWPKIRSRGGRRMEWMLTLRTASRLFTVMIDVETSFFLFPINA